MIQNGCYDFVVSTTRRPTSILWCYVLVAIYSLSKVSHANDVCEDKTIINCAVRRCPRTWDAVGDIVIFRLRANFLSLLSKLEAVPVSTIQVFFCFYCDRYIPYYELSRLFSIVPPWR